jgi:hypothetical protein
MGARERKIREFWGGRLGGNIHICRVAGVILIFAMVVNGARKE